MSVVCIHRSNNLSLHRVTLYLGFQEEAPNWTGDNTVAILLCDKSESPSSFLSFYCVFPVLDGLIRIMFKPGIFFQIQIPKKSTTHECYSNTFSQEELFKSNGLM